MTTETKEYAQLAARVYTTTDANKLESPSGVWCWGTRDPNPHGNAAPVLLQAYAELAETLYAQLAVQGFLKPLFDKIVFTQDAATQKTSADLSGVAADISVQIGINQSAGKELLSEFVRALKGMNLQGEADVQAFRTSLTPLGNDFLDGRAGNDASMNTLHLIASYARHTVATGRFDAGNRHFKIKNQHFRWRLERSNAKTAHAASMRLASHKGLGRRMDAAWGSSGIQTNTQTPEVPQ